MVPVVDVPFQRSESALDASESEIIPYPACQEREKCVDPIQESERVEDGDEFSVDVADDVSEFLLGKDRVEQFRIDIGKGRGEIASDHPVTADADDAGGRILGGVDGDMCIHVRETWVCWTPGYLGLATTAVIGRHGVVDSSRVTIVVAVAAADNSRCCRLSSECFVFD